jgi:hypothetical protein
MKEKRITEFDYNLPAENCLTGEPDVYIKASAEWRKGAFYPDGRPIVIFYGPVMTHLTINLLLTVKDWHLVFKDIELMAQDWFMDQYCVDEIKTPSKSN